MRTYDQLTEAEQEEAKNIALTNLLEDILKRGLRFNDTLNHDDLQARIDDAILQADDNQTPWFADEYILEDCRVELEGMASCDAEDALYPTRAENIIRLKGA